MEIDLYKPKKVIVLGGNGTGKSFFVKTLLESYKGAIFVYDWHGEYKDHPKKDMIYYVPKFKTDFDKRRVEFDYVMFKSFNNSSKIKLAVLDELNEYAPARKTMPHAMEDLRSNHRHYKQTYIGIARRPVDLNTSLIEVAELRIFFRLDGKNDLMYCDALHEGLREVVKNLDEYEFAVLDNKGKITVCKPVKSANLYVT